jgi:hypothetical protein
MNRGKKLTLSRVGNKGPSISERVGPAFTLD